jgi:hypothetical protein
VENVELGSKGNSSKTPETNEFRAKVCHPIILTPEANLISLQRETKTSCGRGVHLPEHCKRNPITSKSMVDYNAIQEFRTEKNLHFFTFYTKADKPVKAFIRHLPGNISAENITVGLDYDVASVKQMTAKRPTPEGEVPLFLVTLARHKKSLEIFKLTTICNIVLKVEAYRSQNGLTQCYNCQSFGHIWVHCRQPPYCL